MEQAIKEIDYCRRAGGVSLIDMTVKGIGRDPLNLKKISQATGVNIICGTGYYVESSHPKEVAKKSADELAEGMICEIRTGIANTGVRAGMIGEIGVSPAGIRPNEKKVLEASAKAHKETGAPMAVHTWSGTGLSVIPTKVLDPLERLDVDLKHVALCHMDWLKDWEYVAELAERGPFVAFDGFGKNFPAFMYNQGVSGSPIIIPTDYERVQGIKELCEKELMSHVHLADDICNKFELKKYGGWGYDNILLNVLKTFAFLGVSEKQFMKMMVNNTRAFFQ